MQQCRHQLHPVLGANTGIGAPLLPAAGVSTTLVCTARTDDLWSSPQPAMRTMRDNVVTL
jgi:hypothetical protein